MATGILPDRVLFSAALPCEAPPPTWLRDSAAAKRNLAGGLRHTQQPPGEPKSRWMRLSRRPPLLPSDSAREQE
jgi:hypothetical protein